MTASGPAQAQQRVLSTLNKDGSRRWLYPRVSPGRFLSARRWVAYGLIVIYTVLPWITINGRPAILLDVPAREFTFFGATFLPTDTLLLMLFIAAVFVGVFLITALFGRLWCGWACPQTVYMEFIYRPIERLFDGPPDKVRRGGGKASGFRKVLKYGMFFLVSLHLAHTFLAYFVGAENLFNWTLGSPFEHPTGFIVVWFTTGLIMFDFCYFREQTCIVACPYGRFQSVMLDRNSLIISYDEKRGEPRGKIRHKKNKDVSLPVNGDCIDCHMCVVTCPTGIDIREGLQMECIGCAQCIDACDTVMDKIDRPRGLIRYTSQAAVEEGDTKLLRPRVVLYPLLLTAIIVTFVVVLVNKAPADITVLRSGNRPYVTLADGEIANDAQVKIVNRTEQTQTYTLSLQGIDAAHIGTGREPVIVEPGETEMRLMTIVAPPEAFTMGRAQIFVLVSDGEEYTKRIRYRLQGPWNADSPDDADDDAGDDES